MKKITYTLLISLFVFVGNANAQEGKTIIEKDTFTYRKVKITDRDEGVLPLLGNKSRKKPDSDMTPSTKSSDSGIGETPDNLSEEMLSNTLIQAVFCRYKASSCST